MNSTHGFLTIFFCIISISICRADGDNLQDACPTNMAAKETLFNNGFPCKNPSNIVAADFKSTDLNHSGGTANVFRSSVNIVTAADFAGLNTLGLSIVRTDLDIDGIITPHAHPRASELFFLNEGVVLAGFIDTNNTAFQSFVKKGEVFLFPRGLPHYCFNAGFGRATAFSVLNSQNPGVVRIGDVPFESESELIHKIAKTMASLPPSDLKYINNATLAKFSTFHIQ